MSHPMMQNTSLMTSSEYRLFVSNITEQKQNIKRRLHQDILNVIDARVDGLFGSVLKQFDDIIRMHDEKQRQQYLMSQQRQQQQQEQHLNESRVLILPSTSGGGIRPSLKRKLPSRLLKINEHFASSNSDPHLMMAPQAPSQSVSNHASTIKIRNLAHLLQQLDELGQPVSSVASGTSDDVRMGNELQDSDRHLYGTTGGGGGGGGGSHHGSGSGRSQQSTGSGGRGGGGSSGVCPRHPGGPPVSIDSQLVEDDLAYLLAGTGAASGSDSSGFRPRSSMPNSLRFPSNPRNPRTSLTGLLNPYQTPTSSYFTTLPPLSPSTTTSTTTSTAREGRDEDEADGSYDYEENGSAFDSDLNADLNSGYSGANGSQQSGCHLTRSAIRPSSFESSIVAHSTAAGSAGAAYATVSRPTSASGAHSAPAEYGPSSPASADERDGRRDEWDRGRRRGRRPRRQSSEQLLYPASSLAGGDESPVCLSGTGSAVSGRTSSAATTTAPATPTTIIARFTVTPVPELQSTAAVAGGVTTDDEPSSQEIRSEELRLIHELSRIRPNDFLDMSVSDDGSGPIQKQMQQIEEMSSQSSATPTTSSSCSSTTSSASAAAAGSYFCCAAIQTSQDGIVAFTASRSMMASLTSELNNGSNNQQQQQSTSSSSSCVNSTTSSQTTTDQQVMAAAASSTTIKLYRKHRPSTLYQEYKV